MYGKEDEEVSVCEERRRTKYLLYEAVPNRVYPAGLPGDAVLEPSGLTCRVQDHVGNPTLMKELLRTDYTSQLNADRIYENQFSSVP